MCQKVVTGEMDRGISSSQDNLVALMLANSEAREA